MIKDLSKKLKDLRIQNKLTQKQVSVLLGISPSIISGYETGERIPSAEVLLSLSYLYKCSTDYLLGKDNEMPNIFLDTTGFTHNQIQALSNLIDTMKRNDY